jgi:hypothetical protein
MVTPLATTAIVRAGLLTAVVDGLFSSVLSAFFYRSTVMRLFQNVASTVLGAKALEGGWTTAALGIAIHVAVAFTWSAVFVLVVMQLPALRRALGSFPGVLGVAAVYGPCVWLVMSLLVIPFLTGRPTAFTSRWWIQLVGHAPFVGLPIVAMGARRS